MDKPVTWQIPARDLDSEDVRYKQSPSWFCDITHSWPPMSTLGAYHWNRYLPAADCLSREHILCLPKLQGDDKRDLNGATYRRVFVVTDPEEIKKREVIYRQNMQPYLKDFPGLWKKATLEMEELYAPVQNFDFENATYVALREVLWDLQTIGRKCWEYHALWMNIIFSGWVWFEKLCEEYLGICDNDAEFMKLVTGRDHKLFQVDKTLWQLAGKAEKEGLAPIFQDSPVDDIMAALKSTPDAAEWLSEFEEFLKINGWRMQHMHDFIYPTWIEDPSPAFYAIKAFLKMDGDQWRLDTIRPELAKERDNAVHEVLKKIPPAVKEEFEGLLKLSQQATGWSEEHTFWNEMMGHATIRHGYLGIGQRFVQEGVIDDKEDIFYLIPDEIESAILVPSRYDLRYLVEPRKAARAQRTYDSIVPLFTTRGSFEEAFEKDVLPGDDAIGAKVVGFEIAEARPELNADMYGLFGAPGLTEGKARVVETIEDLNALQPGEIMVSRKVSSSWTPYFALLNGCVVDRGGSLGHAGCICREYGFPSVVNLVDNDRQLVSGPAKIKTGQTIRIDGTNHAVYILD